MKLFPVALLLAAAMLLAGCHSAGPVASGPEDQAVQTPVAVRPAEPMPPASSADASSATAMPQPAAQRPDPYALDQFVSPEERVQLTTAGEATRAQIIANARARQAEALEYKQAMEEDWQRNRHAGESLRNWSISKPPAPTH